MCTVINPDALCYFSGMRGSTPLDVAAASCIDNNELALALQEQDLEMVKIKIQSRGQKLKYYANSSSHEGTYIFPGGEVFGWMWTSKLSDAAVQRIP